MDKSDIDSMIKRIRAEAVRLERGPQRRGELPVVLVRINAPMRFRVPLREVETFIRMLESGF